MDKKEQTIYQSEEQVPLFGYHLIRNVLLHELLGKEHDHILYWTGKTIARSYPMSTITGIIDFFQKAGWGELEVKKQGKDEISFLLYPSVSKKQFNVSYQLEAGFLAEQIEKQTGCITETATTEKREYIQFSVKTDIKDTVQEGGILNY
ncbi:YslB family protein [Bacillus alkalicellulosilyticus]|uniref:YslB family protein n=1 Tax=Alkalihalobacterium alkalicellulosilyticum TaxID=1912214 RepID=UPI001FE6E0A9|nr:YslB family protein [Bacillus alkalicellulosilyticus]